MRPEITAKWAKEKATEVLGTKVKEQLTKCFDSIEIAVKRNEYSTRVNIYPDELTKQELTKRGFKVEMCHGAHQLDGDEFKISW